ncbi:MAG: hypothetical protein ABSC03_06785 [Verrucomicrobiota bacterium]|jgi:integrase
MKPRKFPEKLRQGNSSCVIYRNTNPLRPGGEDFKLAFYDLDGKRRFRSFADYRDAREAADAVLLKAARGELETLDMDRAAVVAYSRAALALKPFNIPVDRAAEDYARLLELLGGSVQPVEAVRYYLRKHPRELPPRTVAEVTAELLTEKEAQGLSATYTGDLRWRCNNFARSFQVQIAAVTGADIRDWLAARKLSPRSYNNFLRALRTLFEFAKTRGYLAKDHDEVDGVALRKDRGGDIEIFTPEEIAGLLAAATPDLLPVIAIGGFAGLRSAEIERLDWSEIHLAGPFIEITAGKAKTASRRLAPVPENLAAWLAPYAQQTGRVWPHTHAYLYEALRKVAERAKVPWKHNALRHSFISYRLAAIQNTNQVALEAGNSPQMIFAHYRELVRPQDAANWFAVAPTPAANVAPMRDAVAAAG